MANVLTTTTQGSVTCVGTDAAGNAINQTVQLGALVNTAPVAPFTEPLTLAGGFTQVAIPAGYRKATISPAQNSAATLTLKGVTGDTGFPIDPVSWTILGFAAGASTFGITASAGVTIQITWS